MRNLTRLVAVHNPFYLLSAAFFLHATGAWAQQQGRELPDLVRMSLIGGYLTLMTGIRIERRPRALVAYWGYGDVDGDWYTRPSEHYRKAVPLIAKEDAYKGVGDEFLVATGQSVACTGHGDQLVGHPVPGEFLLHVHRELVRNVSVLRAVD